VARRSPGRQDNLIYPSFAEQGLLHDMTGLVNDPAWADERAAIESFAWDLAEQQGGTWGVPVLGAVYNIFINKTLLEEAGVLETWDDSYESMLEAAQALTTDDVYGWAARTSAADFAWWDWYPYVHNAGADVLSADGTSCGLVGSDVTDAMQFLIDIHTAGVSPPAGSLDNQGLYDLFKAGRIAILHHETPNIPDLLADPPDFEWDVALAPPGPQGHTVMGNFGILSISPRSAPAVCWDRRPTWASTTGTRRSPARWSAPASSTLSCTAPWRFRPCSSLRWCSRWPCEPFRGARPRSGWPCTSPPCSPPSSRL